MDWSVRVSHSENYAVTDGNGNYSLSVPSGAVTVRERPQAGWAQSFPSGGGHFLNTTGSGQTIPAIDFGNTPANTIHGTKYLDVNADGGIDPVDPVLAGETIYIDQNNNEVLDNGEPSAVTDAAGKYVITNVSPGTHLLREVLPPGWIQTYPGPGPQTVIHTAGQFHRFHNFGNAYSGSISGAVFNDDNADGVNNAGEGLLGNFTIYADLNNNGQFDPTDPSTVSNTRLGYVLSGIPIEEPITLRAIPPFSTTTQWQISTAPAPVELTFAQPRASLRNFGAFRPGSIAGSIFHDLNANGIFDATEPGLGGWTTYLDENGNGQLDGGPQTTQSRDVPRSIVSRPVTSDLPIRNVDWCAHRRERDVERFVSRPAAPDGRADQPFEKFRAAVCRAGSRGEFQQHELMRRGSRSARAGPRMKAASCRNSRCRCSTARTPTGRGH